MTESKNLTTTVAGHLCLDIHYPNSDSVLEMCERIQPGITSNPKGNLTVITEPLKRTDYDLFQQFIDQATQTGNVSTGGLVSNVGIPLSRLLGPRNVGLMARIGTDPIGIKIEEVILQHHVGPLFLNKSGGETTSYTLVHTDPATGTSHYYHHPGTNNAFSSSDLDWDFIGRSTAFCFGYPPLLQRFADSGTELPDLFKRVKEKGNQIRTYLDMCGMREDDPREIQKWQRRIKDTLPFVNGFMPNLEEAIYLFDINLLGRLRQKVKAEERINSGYDILDAMEDPKPSLDNVGRYFLSFSEHQSGTVVLKCGKRGLFMVVPGSERFVPAYIPEHIVNTTGAGDNVDAAIVAGTQRGYGDMRCLELGVRAGLRNVECPNAIDGVTTFQDLDNDAAFEKYHKIESRYFFRP